MKKIICLFSTSILCFFSVFAQRGHFVSEELKDAFAAKLDRSGTTPILVREAVIHQELSDSAMLVIFLHSAGGRGYDNLSQLGMPAVKSVYDYLNRNNRHAYFIVPQCPEAASWSGVAPGEDGRRDDGSGPHRPVFGSGKPKLKNRTPFVRHLMPMIRNYLSVYPIAKSKVYVLGASMGAAGVWELIAENPEDFAAALPASGSYRGKDFASLIKTPIICTAGGDEHSYMKNKRLIEKLKSMGADAMFFPLEGKGHVQACNEAFSKEVLDLFFSKHR